MLLGRSSIRVLVALACAAAALAVAGCGSSSNSSSGTGANTVIRAAFVSTNTSGYQMRFTVQLSSAALPQPITGVGTGSFDPRAHNGALAFDMNLGSSPQVTQVLGSSTLHLEEVLNGTTVYVKLPDAITGKLPALSGKPWIKIDLAQAASAAGIPGLSSLVNNPTSSDPSQFLEYLRAAGTVTKQGSAVVDGVSTTQYRAVISLDRVADTLPAASRAGAAQAVAAIEKASSVHQIPVTVWIDGQNLVRRMRMSLNEVASGQSVATQITVDILKYGPQPAAPPPPADQVTDASALAGALG